MTSPSTSGADDGTPSADRREQILDPSAGASGHRSESIRDEQSTHQAGAVPAAYEGDAVDGERAEDAAKEPDTWDSADHRN